MINGKSIGFYAARNFSQSLAASPWHSHPHPHPHPHSFHSPSFPPFPCYYHTLAFSHPRYHHSSIYTDRAVHQRSGFSNCSCQLLKGLLSSSPSNSSYTITTRTRAVMNSSSGDSNMSTTTASHVVADGDGESTRGTNITPSKHDRDTMSSTNGNVKGNVSATTNGTGSGSGNGSVSAPGSKVAKVAQPRYKFTRADFGPLPVKPLHLDLHFDILEERVKVISTTTFLLADDQPLTDTIRLNSQDLEIQSFQRIDAGHTLRTDGRPDDFVKHMSSMKEDTLRTVSYDVDLEQQIVAVKLDKPVQAGQQFTLRSVSIARPTANKLEGIYYDYTPPAKGNEEPKPRTMITQCQQYGFQRIVPSIDMMPAKAYYTVTIVADKRYNQVITNGDPAPGYFDPATGDRKPHDELAADAPPDKPSNTQRFVYKYYNHTTNMASYLFFLGCGHYTTYKRFLEYPTPHGYDTIQIELLTIQGLVEDKHANNAIESLGRHITWTYLSTGPEQYQHHDERKEIYALIEERDRLKESEGEVARLSELRQRLSQLISVWKKTGYKYTGKVYREIGMENSDYGGMENVGNTTILSSRLTPSDLVTDQGYIYVEGVKIHEYYHNINGSQVTGQCLAAGTEVMLWDGSVKRVENLVATDQLMGDDYTPRNILRFVNYPHQGQQDQAQLYKISPVATVTGHNSTRAGVNQIPFKATRNHILCFVVDTPPTLSVPHSKDNNYRVYSWQWVGKEPDLYLSRSTLYKFPPTSQALAQAHLATAIQQFQPMHLEKTVDWFLAHSNTNTRKDFKMYRPATAVQYDPTLENVLLNLLKQFTPDLEDHNDEWWEAAVHKTMWIIGLWLADGSKENASILQGGPPEGQPKSHAQVFTRCEEWANLFPGYAQYTKEFHKYSPTSGHPGYEIVFGVGDTYTQRRKSGLFWKLLSHFNLLAQHLQGNNKHIPAEFFVAAITARQWLWAGIIDGAGWYEGSLYRYGIRLRDAQLLLQVKKMSLQLGMRVSKITESIANRDDDDEPDIEEDEAAPMYMIRASGYQICEIADKLSLTHKRVVDYERSNTDNQWSFKIQEAEVGVYYGFVLDGNQKFLLADQTVTHNSPFEIWLNEAQTVHVQRQREHELFGFDYLRLRDVITAFTPSQGPLAVDRSVNAMAIEPEGFNRTQELISGMTYFKAPEFVRMVETIITPNVFNVGLDQYHTEHAYSNATSHDWLQAMVDASGNRDLYQFAELWLKRTGYPDISYTTSYEEGTKRYTVNLHQSGFERSSALTDTPWYVPIKYALIKDGVELMSGFHLMKDAHDVISISNVAEPPDFISFARQWSYYGTSKWDNATSSQLFKQALSDTDVVNRYTAYRAIADVQKAALIESMARKEAGSGSVTGGVSDEYVELHSRILFDDSLLPACRALLCREGEDISSRSDLSHYYQEISDAKTALLAAVYAKHSDRIVELYNTIESRNRPGPHLDQLQDRALKHHLFALIQAGNKLVVGKQVDTVRMMSDLFHSTFMSDQFYALSQYLSDTHASREQKQSFLNKAKEQYSKHPDSIESYITVVSSADSDDAVELIDTLVNDKNLFNISLAGHARGVARGWAGQRKRSLMTASGLALTVRLIDKIGHVNQMSAQAFVHAFNDLPKFTPERREALKAAIRAARDTFDQKKYQSLYNQFTTLLAS